MQQCKWVEGVGSHVPGKTEQTCFIMSKGQISQVAVLVNTLVGLSYLFLMYESNKP